MRNGSNGLMMDAAVDGAVRLEGELDAATAPRLQRLLDDQPWVTVLDMRSVKFIDAGGLRALLHANGTRLGADRLTLRSPAAAVRRVLELAELTEVFVIETDAN
jgi:anti-anti-sigma factor